MAEIPNSRADVVTEKGFVVAQIELAVADNGVCPDVFPFRNLKATDGFELALGWFLQRHHSALGQAVETAVCVDQRTALQVSDGGKRACFTASQPRATPRPEAPYT